MKIYSSSNNSGNGFAELSNNSAAIYTANHSNAEVRFGSVLESDDTADDRTVVIAPIPLQHKNPIQPSNEADMQDALIAAHLLHIILHLSTGKYTRRDAIRKGRVNGGSGDDGMGGGQGVLTGGNGERKMGSKSGSKRERVD